MLGFSTQDKMHVIRRQRSIFTCFTRAGTLNLSPGLSGSLVRCLNRLLVRVSVHQVVKTGGTARKMWVQLPRGSTIVVVVRLTFLEHHEVRHGYRYRLPVGRSTVALSSSEPPSTLSALQSGARTLVLNTIARRVADIRRGACRTAHIRAAVVNVCTVGHGLYPEHQGCHRREAYQCMKAEHADLSGHKSLGYAPF